ncbi:MAG: arabinan endo-1,5-alpha-L-arabinosidase [Lachnospiraceae bacterium]|nr:arabinan endo-1,5-alpha-L-arabinosidase [Lachnospiraceae bacterium]
MNCSPVFPAEPPKPLPKPKFPKGRKKPSSPPPPPPKNSLWGAHDPAIYRDPVSHRYYIYCTGANCFRSDDLIRWERLGRVVESPPKESLEWVGDKGIWAPDIVKVGSEYRLYCSNSSWGVRQSCIFLAVADNPEGPFVPRGCVLKTSEPDSPCNAIDANIVSDEETGEQYMVYGSFWGGCHILKLDPETGLAAEEGIGTCLARRPRWADCAIEGPYVRYNPDTGYYYLFVSYGSLKSDYNIRVGRSRKVTGPYFDINGRDMRDLEDYDNTVGYMVMCGYKFEDGVGYMGPGHNSVLRDEDGRWYLICHIREHNFKGPEISIMHCHQMLWSEDGWPLVVPEQYSGEYSQPLPEHTLIGSYERLKLAPSVPQGITHSVPLKLRPHGKLELCSVPGRWSIVNDSTIRLTYANTTETLKVIPVWDYQLWRPTLAFTGKDEHGICVWGKKVPDIKN